MQHDAIIETRDLTKAYAGTKRALDKLNLTVQRGEIFGYLGSNGAGKTTTIRLLLDLIRPSDGSAKIFGLDTRQNSRDIRARIGFLPGELNLWDNMSALQTIRYVGRVRGGVEMAYVNQLAERLQFDMTKKVKSYSTGNKRKLGLILAMMNKPDLLILDEPSSGLDPLMQQEFNNLMLEAQKAGSTVFLSSHVLGEVQTICDRVAIIRQGQLQAVERVDRLTHADFRWVTVRFRDAINVNVFSGVQGVSDITSEGNLTRMRLIGDFDPLLRVIAPHYVEDLRVQEPTLEEVFLAFYGEKSMAGEGVTQ